MNPLELTQRQLIIPVLIFLVNETLKKQYNLDSKYCVIVNVLLGVILNTTLMYGRNHIITNVSVGVIVGLSTGGAYDYKKLLQRSKNNE